MGIEKAFPGKSLKRTHREIIIIISFNIYHIEKKMGLLVDEASCECTTSSLEWFDVLPTQTTIAKSTWSEYQPLGSLSNDSDIVEFYVSPEVNEYMDLKNSYMRVKFRIMAKDGTACKDTDKVAPINDTFNGIWKNVELFLNDRLVSQSNSCHGYIAMLKTLLFSTEEAVTSQKTNQLFFKDTPGQLDCTNPFLPNDAKVIPGWSRKQDEDYAVINTDVRNNGLHKRYLYTQTSTVTEMVGPLPLDLFEQVRYIPNGVKMKLRFEKQRNPFVLMSPVETFKFELMSVNLYIRKVTPSPGVLLGHAQALTKGTAKFPITRTTCSVISVSQGHSSNTEDNMFLGQLPKTLVIGMVADDAFTGSFNRNPYYFKSFDLRSLVLTANGVIVPGTPLKLDRNDSAAVFYQTMFH